MPALKKAVSEGRRSEFKDFDFNDFPDPEDPQTFERSKLTWADSAQNREMLEWYRRLLQLRKQYVTHNNRTADANYEAGVMTMTVPAIKPKLMVQAALQPGATLPAVQGGWEAILQAEDGGYRVQVLVR